MKTSALEERIAKLEANLAILQKQNKRSAISRLFLILLLTAAIGLGFKAATQTDSLQTREIRADEIRVNELIITKGTAFPKAILRARSDGKSGLEIRDSSQRVLLRLPEAGETD